MSRTPALARRSPPRARGAALVVGLLMLLVLTLIAFAGVNTATTELVMAGNEQYRRNATLAANAGIETAITRLRDVSTSEAAPPTVVTNESVPDSDTDRFTTSTRYVGSEFGLPQSSADKFVGLHYAITANGTSARNSADQQVQGVLVIAGAPSGGESSYGRIGSGL